MAVTRDVPKAGDNINESQPLLLANSQGYFDTFAEDHVGYNDAGAGYHNKVTMPEQAVDASAVASAGVFYTVKSTTLKGDRTDVYYRYQSTGTSLSSQIFPVNFVKAFGKADSGAGDRKIAETTFNVDSISYSASSALVATYTINLTTPISDDVDKIMIFASAMGTAGTPTFINTATSTSILKCVINSGAGSTPVSNIKIAFMAVAI